MTRYRRFSLRRLIVIIISLATGATAIKAMPDKPGNRPEPIIYENRQVIKVIDGDTIVVDLNGQSETIRLIGIDTPETSDPRKPVQCFGREASDWTKQHLAGRKVRLESDPTQGSLDRYQRHLAYVYRDDGLFINQALISEGYANEYTYQSIPYKYQAEFQAAESEARQNNLGLWSQSACKGDTNQAALKS